MYKEKQYQLHTLWQKSVHMYFTQMCTDSNITLYSITEQVVSFLLYP